MTDRGIRYDGLGQQCIQLIAPARVRQSHESEDRRDLDHLGFYVECVCRPQLVEQRGKETVRKLAIDKQACLLVVVPETQ